MAIFEGTARRDHIEGTLDVDEIIGREGDDLLYGGLGDDVITGGDGRDSLWGDAEVAGDDRVLEGGNDRLSGGAGADRLFGDGAVKSWVGSARFVGGDDQLSGGDGNDVIYGDGFCQEAADFTFFEGGDDRLVGGRGDDVLVGDGVGRGALGDEYVGGADVFVFRKGYGRDVISDFSAAEGDRVELAGTGLTWNRLDTDGDGALDAGDRWVDAHAGGADAVTLDVGRATRGAPAGVDTLTVAAGLTEADFLFV